MRKLLFPLLSFGFAASALALEPDVLFERLAPSVWVVFAHDAEGVRMTSGSAVVIDREQLVTSCSILKKAKSISVRRQGLSYGAQLLHADTERDLCILKAPGLAAPSVKIATPKSARVGQKVIGLAAPTGAELALSDGMVNSISRSNADETMGLQVSFPVEPGSTGGGLFDRDGKLIGLSSAGVVRIQGSNVFIPAEWIADVPKRATQALEAMRAADAARAAKLASPTQGVVVESLLSGPEMSAHFAKFGAVQAVGSGGNSYKFELTWGKGFNLTNLDNRNRASGVYSIKEASGQICLSPSVPPNSKWMAWKDCYRLYALGENRFSLRSLSDEQSLTYSKSGG